MEAVSSSLEPALEPSLSVPLSVPSLLPLLLPPGVLLPLSPVLSDEELLLVSDVVAFSDPV